MKTHPGVVALLVEAPLEGLLESHHPLSLAWVDCLATSIAGAAIPTAYQARVLRGSRQPATSHLVDGLVGAPLEWHREPE